MAEQPSSFVFAVILRARVGRDGVFAGQEWYRERVAILETPGAETAGAVTELLNSSLGEGPGEDYPEGFVAIPSAELTLAENTQARRDLQSSDDWHVALRNDAQAELAEVERTRLGSDGKTDHRRNAESGDIDASIETGSVVPRDQARPPMVGGSELLMDEADELLSVEEVASFIKMSERTVYRMMDEGLRYMQPENKPNSHRRIRKSDVLAWRGAVIPRSRK